LELPSFFLDRAQQFNSVDQSQRGSNHVVKAAEEIRPAAASSAIYTGLWRVETRADLGGGKGHQDAKSCNIIVILYIMYTRYVIIT